MFARVTRCDVACALRFRAPFVHTRHDKVGSETGVGCEVLRWGESHESQPNNLGPNSRPSWFP
jgi:hypothetical protein